MDAEEKLTRARIQLQKTNPFFAFLLMHAVMKEDTGQAGMPLSTIGVDAKGNMWYNKTWVNGLSDREMEGVLCHEIMHVALEHLYRSKKMKAKQRIHNIAADLVVNDILVESGFSLPEHGCVPSGHKFHNNQISIEKIDEKCVEEIYEEILVQIPEVECPMGCSGQESNGGDSPCDGCPNQEDCVGDIDTLDQHIMSDKGKGGKKAKKQARQWKKRVAEAGHYAKMRGDLPVGLERRIGEIFESKLDWKKMLNHYITSAIPHDYTWRRPSSKAVANGMYLPSIVNDQKLEIVVAIDTSGSISQEELGMFLGEMVGIAKSYNQVTMRVIECDCEIQQDILVQNGNIKKIQEIQVKGGGGTAHEPIYEYLAKEYPQTKILINFTDGYTSFPERQDWKWDTIWVLTKNSCDEDHIPFGKILKAD